MSYRLRMSDEIRAWLTDLCADDPDSAMIVGRALTALIDEGANLGPPLIGPLAGELEPDELIEALEGAHELRLEQLMQLRHAEAEAAVAGRERPLFEPDELAALQVDADRFRVRKDVLRARYVSAEALLAIDGTDAAAAGQLAEVTAQMRQELAGGSDLADALMELRPGAPGHGDVLIFFAVEPAGTALLLSVLEGARAIRRDLVQAMMISADVLRQVRAGLDPDAGEWEFAGKRAFLGEFFAGTAGDQSR